MMKEYTRLLKETETDNLFMGNTWYVGLMFSECAKNIPKMAYSKMDIQI